MSDTKSLDDILSDVDEQEESLDRPEAEAAPEPGTQTKSEPEPEKVEAKQEQPPEEGSKDGLPPWMHARIKAAQEKADAAERQRQELESRFNETNQQLSQFQQWYQQQTGQQVTAEQRIGQQIEQMQANFSEQLRQRDLQVNRAMAEQRHGAELVEQAHKWGLDKCDADPAFNQAVAQSATPYDYVVDQYRRELALQQLDQYGGDLDKLVAARMAEANTQNLESQPETSTGSVAQAMPGDFASAPNQKGGGQARSGTAFAGPTPLSKLLGE